MSFDPFDLFEENAFFNSLAEDNDDLTRYENSFYGDFDSEFLSDDDVYMDEEDCFSYIPLNERDMFVDESFEDDIFEDDF